MGISLGLVGLGSFGAAFVDLFAAHPLVDRMALCDREADRVAAFAQRPALQGKLKPADLYTSFDEICRSDLDALAIITQPWLHAPRRCKRWSKASMSIVRCPSSRCPMVNDCLCPIGAIPPVAPNRNFKL